MSYKLYTNKKEFISKITNKELFNFVKHIGKYNIYLYFDNEFNSNRDLKYVLVKNNNIIDTNLLYKRFLQSKKKNKVKKRISEINNKRSGSKNRLKLYKVKSFKESLHSYKKEYSESLYDEYSRIKRVNNISYKFKKDYDDWCYDKRKVTQKSWKYQTKKRKQWY